MFFRIVVYITKHFLPEYVSWLTETTLTGSKRSKHENLKEMGDVSSGMASTVIQLYLKEILGSFLHHSTVVRSSAMKVVQLVLAQGLVHPVQVSVCCVLPAAPLAAVCNTCK